MNDKETKTFDTQAINDVTQTSGVIPASTVTAPQPTLVVPEINMKESAPIANQAVQSAQAQTEEQTNLQNLTDQRIVDQQKQFAEQESLAQTIGGGGDLLRNEFSRGQEVLKPIEKDIQDLNSLINQKTRSVQNQIMDEEGRIIPKAFVTGRQAIIQQRGAADIASLGALLDAKNGMLSNAQEKLNQSLQISQAVQKAEVGEKQARITLLKEITGVSQDEEQKEVDKLQAEAKKFEEERDAISSIALQAMQSGAGADEIQRITQSKSEDEAIGNATSLGKIAELDLQIKRQTIAKNNIAMQVAQAEKLQQSSPVQAEAKRASSKATLDLVTGMIGNPVGIQSSVGTTILGRVSNPFFLADSTKFRANAKTLTAKDTLNSLIDVKSQGATFGALSDGERQLVAQAANELAGFAIYDNVGNPTGRFRGSESNVFNAMQVIQENAAKSFFRNGGVVTPELKPIADKLADEYVNEIQTILQTNEYENAGY